MTITTVLAFSPPDVPDLVIRQARKRVTIGGMRPVVFALRSAAAFALGVLAAAVLPTVPTLVASAFGG